MIYEIACRLVLRLEFRSVISPDSAEPALLSFGVQKKGGVQPVDADSLFEIGSLSKTFITLGISALVAKG